MNGSRKRASVSNKEEMNQVTSTSNLVKGKKNHFRSTYPSNVHANLSQTVVNTDREG